MKMLYKVTYISEGKERIIIVRTLRTARKMSKVLHGKIVLLSGNGVIKKEGV